MSLDHFKICSKIEPKLKKIVKAFHVFDDKNGLNVLFITSDDNVYGFGQNRFGCCGFGHNYVVNEPQVIPELCHKSVKQFFIGYTFVLALNSDEQVYAWGWNIWGQLATGSLGDVNEYFKPKLISYSADKTIIQLSCGSAHSIAMTSDGLIYGWGWNIYGQIGVGKDQGKNTTTPVLLKSFLNIEIESIYCSYCQSFALTTDGCVYSWGYNDWCQLGHELEKDEVVYEPKLINNLSNIICIASGRINTYFLTNDGLIYFCGKFSENQFQKLPKIIEINTRIDSLHTVCYYRKFLSIAIGMNREGVFHFTNNNIRKSESKSYLDYISTNYEMTHKTIDLGFDHMKDKTLNTSEDIRTEEESVSMKKHLKIFNKLDSGAFGQVFKVKHQLDQQFYAIKSIDFPGTQLLTY